MKLVVGRAIFEQENVKHGSPPDAIGERRSRLLAAQTKTETGFDLGPPVPDCTHNTHTHLQQRRSRLVISPQPLRERLLPHPRTKPSAKTPRQPPSSHSAMLEVSGETTHWRVIWALREGFAGDVVFALDFGGGVGGVVDATGGEVDPSCWRVGSVEVNGLGKWQREWE